MTDPVTLRYCADTTSGAGHMGSVIKKRRKRMAKKKHRKLLKKTRVQRRNKK
ncbi:30S ribosomal protein bS22 [Modestobacter altitudinis]|uniref:30S ribosomal protein bS22 n=1 Tax=Modestobacter altitudinis TaxID=2213158 RepID=UPI003F6DA9D4